MKPCDSESGEQLGGPWREGTGGLSGGLPGPVPSSQDWHCGCPGGSCPLCPSGWAQAMWSQLTGFSPFSCLASRL